MFGFRINQPKILVIKIAVIFVPIFAIAHLTQNMVYILPTLAIGMVLGGSITGDTKTDHEDIEGDSGDS